MNTSDHIDFHRLSWRKSSYSGQGGGQCVEVADTGTGSTAVRDSKNADGPVLLFSAKQWAAFLDHQA